MDLALHDRPALKEILGILAACAVLLIVLAKLDNQAAREYTARAVKALAAQKAADEPHEHARPVVPVEARTESLGARGPISIPVGAAWTAGTSATVARSLPAQPLRRIVGPVPVGAVSERVAPVGPKPAPARVVVATVREPRRDHRRSAILAMLMAAGLLIAASGALMLSRRSA